MAEGNNHKASEFSKHGGLGRDEEGTSLAIEDEYDNLPPIEQRLWERDKEQEAERNTRSSLQPSQPLPSPGPFIALEDRSWGAHADLIKDESNGLAFDPSRLFDEIVAAKSSIRGLYDPSSGDYAKYEGLRVNLAVLRNFLLSGGMDAAHLKTAAEALGEAFAHDRWFLRPFTSWLSTDVANVEAVGAGEIYKYLLEVQEKPAPLQWLRNFVNSLLARIGIDVPDRTWGLQSVELTPFSPRNLAAPPTAYETEAQQTNFAERYRNRPPAGIQLSRA